MSTENPKLGKTVVDRALLRDFVDGKLDSAVQVKVAAFIEQHPYLLAQVEAMSANGFVAKVRAAHCQPEDAAVAVDESRGIDIELRLSKVLPALPIQGVPAELESYTGYKIVRELGRGGMGIVYLAENVQLGGRREVLKVLNERLLAVPEAKERFRREIFAVSQLKHPSIVTAYSVLPFPTQLVFAMEYVDGKDLATLIREQQPLSIAVACTIIQQVAAGLHHGHENNLVHRDIKPSNIMVYRSGKKVGAKILDYGLAKPTDEKPTEGLTQDGVMMGTIEYIAPEQILSAAAADKLSDIYSLGCTLYHALAGRPPFGGTMRELMAAHWHTEAPFVNILRPEVPIELAAIVAKMMAKEPNKRFASAGELAAKLRPFLKSTFAISKTSNPMPEPTFESSHDTQGVISKANIDTSVDGTEQLPNEYPSLPDLAQSTASESQSLSPLAHSYGRGVGGEGPPRLGPASSTPGTRESQSATNQSLVESLRLLRIRPLRRKSNHQIAIALGCCLALFGITWFGGFLKIKTPHGTLLIENLPSDAEVLVDGEQVGVTWDNDTSNAKVSIFPGSHAVELTDGEQTVASTTLRIVDGKTEKWSVSLGVDGDKISLNDGGFSTDEASVTTSNTDNSNMKPKTFSFLEGARSRNVSIVERMAFEDAVKSHRQLTNGNFKDGFDGWEIQGGARSFRFGKPRSDGSRYITTWGESQNRDTGRLFQCFEVPKGATHLTFKIHGGSDPEKLFIALSYRDKEIWRATAKDSNNAFRVEWRVKELQGEVLTLEIVDHFTAPGWPHIGAEDFNLVHEN